MDQSFSIINQEVRGNCLKAVSLAPEGYEVIIRPKAKTPKQRRYWHNIIGIVAEFSGHTNARMKHMLKKAVLGEETWTTKKETYTMVPPSEDLDINEYSELIDETKNVARILKCNIPPPSYYGITLERE